MAISARHNLMPVAKHDAEIRAHGVEVLLRKGIQCPCHAKESGQPDPNCNRCEGWGFIWDAGAEAHAFGPNRRINRLYENQGEIDLADAYWTFVAGTFLAHMDRFVNPSEIIVYSEIFTKGEINRQTGASLEKSRFSKITAPVERSVWLERSPASGTPYAYIEHDLVEGTDFSIVNGNKINWLVDGEPPPDGARYSLRFKTEAEYLLWAPRSRSEGAQQYPSQWLAKRVDFIKAPQ